MVKITWKGNTNNKMKKKIDQALKIENINYCES